MRSQVLDRGYAYFIVKPHTRGNVRAQVQEGGVSVMSDGLKVLLAALGGAVLVLLLISVLGGGTMRGMGSMMSAGMMGGGLFGMLFALLFWVLVITLIVALVVWIVKQTQHR
jgi:hypothetical protein